MATRSRPAAKTAEKLEDSIADFVELSAVLTGFSATELRGTGLGAVYYNTVLSIIGERILGRLLRTWGEVRGARGRPGPRTIDELERGVKSKILSHSMMGPVARNIICVWYVGDWYQMPGAWRQEFGASALDVSHVISAQAYQEGLMWRAIGAHPPGAKQMGFGSWTVPPQGAADIEDEWKAPK